MEKVFFRLFPSVRGKKLDDHLWLFDPDRNRQKIVNEVGHKVISLFSSISIGEISELVLDRYEVDGYHNVKQDILNFINELEDDGWIERNDIPFSMGKNVFPDYNDAPDEVDISVTGNCNLRCSYCFYANDMGVRKDLPLIEWLQFFEEIGSLGVRNVTLSGGEVFTRKDFWQIIDGLVENGMSYTILTNGTLIDHDTIFQLSKGKRRTRLISMQVSIDGGVAEVHDKSRGFGSFAKAVRGIGLLKEAKLPVTARLTVNRYNVDHLEDGARFLLEDIGLPSISTNEVVSLGAGCSNATSIALSIGQQVKAIKSLKYLEKKYGGRVTAQAGPLAKWHGYNLMEKAKESGYKNTKYKMGRLSACGCVNNKLAIHNDGKISPCNMLPDFEMGKINNDSIKEIWKNHPLLKEMRERSRVQMKDLAECGQCDWSPYCNGGCPAFPASLSGDLHRPNMHDCYRVFLQASGLHSIVGIDD